MGDYTAVLQAFTAETGAAVEVPLSLTVTQGTDAEDEIEAPRASSLAVYPNPSGGEATFRYTLDAAAEVRLVVYDVLGREVVVLVDEAQPPGTHEAPFERRGLAAGIYIARMEVGTGTTTQTVTRLLTRVR